MMIQNKIWRWPLACALAFSAAAWSEAVSLERNQAEVQAVTFKNPVVWADVPDPDVIFLYGEHDHAPDAWCAGDAFQRFGELGNGKLSFR